MPAPLSITIKGGNKPPYCPTLTIGAGDARLIIDALRAMPLSTVGRFEQTVDLIDLFSASIPQPEPREAQHDRPVRP